VARAPKPYTEAQERFGRRFIGVVSRANAWLYRRTKGRFGAAMPGTRGRAPICLLTTTGRRTGQPRTVALLYLADGGDIVVVASIGGMSKHPEWYLNLVANPAVTIEIGGDAREMTARTASPEEKARLWPRLVAMYKSYDTYQQRTTRAIPVVVCSPAR
jgi:deazaflavin-dependent oxidoreductase (nitroreductase family)